MWHKMALKRIGFGLKVILPVKIKQRYKGFKVVFPRADVCASPGIYWSKSSTLLLVIRKTVSTGRDS
jgi:hypothetical protein